MESVFGDTVAAEQIAFEGEEEEMVLVRQEA